MLLPERCSAMTELESSRRVHSDLSLQNTAKIMSTSMATYLAQNPENTPVLSAENWRNLHNFILCICAIMQRST